MPVPEIPAMYPPLAQLVFCATRLVLPAPDGFKLPFLPADLAVAALLAGWIRSTGGRNYQVAIHAWNPLVVVKFAFSGHNDALANAGVVAPLMIIRRDPAMSTLTLTRGGGQGLPCRVAAIGVLPRGLAREAAQVARGGAAGVGDLSEGKGIRPKNRGGFLVS